MDALLIEGLGLPEEGCHHTLSIYADGSVEIGVDIVACMLVHLAGIRHVDKVTHRLLGDDIHHTGNGIGSVHRRSSTAYDLYAVDHRSRHLLQAIDSRHGREHRARIHQNLRILPLQAIDTQFGLAAVGAGVLDA